MASIFFVYGCYTLFALATVQNDSKNKIGGYLSGLIIILFSNYQHSNATKLGKRDVSCSVMGSIFVVSNALWKIN